MRSFGIGIFNGTSTLGIANNNQLNLKNTNYNFKKSTRPRVQKKKQNEKELTALNVEGLLKGKKWVINAFEREIFPMKIQTFIVIIVLMMMSCILKEY